MTYLFPPEALCLENTVTTKSRSVVTIDGLAGSGKTSIACRLAERLGFVHLNSGILYRVYGFLALQNKVDLADLAQVQSLITNNNIALELDKQSQPFVLLNGQVFAENLQQPEVSEMTSKVSGIELVRLALMEAQRLAFKGCSIVAEGRDMGTVVFPDAPLKFFIEVAENVRIERRLKQLAENEPSLSQDRLNTLKKQMEIELVERDKRDSERALAPTIAANDAIIIRNEGQTLTQVVENMYAACANACLN